MPTNAKIARATWSGDLASGSGEVIDTGSGSLTGLQLTWKARTETEATSPEELLAAAHASCYAMAFSNILAKGGHAPERVEVTARVRFEFGGEGGARVTASELSVSGTVPGLDGQAFQAAAVEAKDGCPISKALAGNLEISVTASLD